MSSKAIYKNTSFPKEMKTELYYWDFFSTYLKVFEFSVQ